MSVIALTFDDGPTKTTTVQTLDKLQKYGVVATYFVLGRNIKPQTTAIMQRAIAMGCEIGNHTQSHPMLNLLSTQEIKNEADAAAKKIFEATGQEAKVFRAPYLAQNEDVYAAVPMVFVDGYHTLDYDSNNGVTFRADKAISQAHDGAVIIMHDFEDNHKTVEALDIIIPALLGQGYRFVTVSELLRLKNPLSQKYIQNWCYYSE